MLPQNPFIVRREIAYGEPFCDREREMAIFLESADSDEALCLLSPRRYGKSSLVNQVLGRLAEKGWITLRLDMMTIRSLKGLVESLEQKRLEASSQWTRIKEGASNLASRVSPQMRIDLETGSPTFSLSLSGPRAGEEDAVVAVLERISNLPRSLQRPVCFAIDEFQEVAGLEPKQRLVGIIRSAFQRRSRGFLPIYLGSMRHMLKLMFENENAPFYRSARMLELKELGVQDFAQFMNSQFRETLGRSMPPEVGRATATIFGGHPHALNLTASRLWTSLQLVNQYDPPVVREVWKEIVSTLIHEERAYYQQINRTLSRPALNVLANIARRGVVAEPYSTQFARECQLTPGQIQTALRLLIKEDKVVESEEGYMVLDPLEAICLKTESVSPDVLHAELERSLEHSGE